MNKRFSTIRALPLLVLAASLAVSLAACQSVQKPKRTPVVTAQHMQCSSGQTAQITLYSPDDARLVYSGRAYDLARVVTASGVKYENRNISYWNKGIEATITLRSGRPDICTYVPKAGL